MSVNLPGWLSPPVLDKSEDTRTARIVHIISCVLLLSGIPASWMCRMFAPVIVLICAECCVLLTLWLNHRGNVKQSATLLSTVLLAAATTLLCVSGEGWHDVAVLLFPATIVIAGVLLDKRLFVFYAIAALSCLTAVGLAEINGILVVTVRVPTDHGDLVNGVLILVITFVTVWMLIGDLRDSLAQSRQHETALAASNEELARQAARLKASEEKFRGIIELAADAIFVAEPQRRIIEVNARACELSGYSKEELTGKPFADLFSAEELQRAPLRYDLIEQGKTVVTERFITRKDGTTVAVEVSSKRMPDGTYQAFCRDITERRRAEEERRRLVAILEATSDLVSFASPDGRVQYLNNAGRRILGYGPDTDISGLTIANAHPDLQRQRILDEALPIAARDGIWSGETVFLGRDNRAISMLQVILAHKTPQGTVEFFSTVARDITDLQHMEMRLRQAEKMEAIGQLSGGIAHDFNNQLAGIMGYADILGRLLKDPNLQVYATNIITTARRAADLTRNLLAFSRRSDLAVAPTDVHEIIREVARLLSHTIDKRIVIQQNLNAKPSVITGDATQLQNALLNMAVNARDAMPNGGTLAFTTNTAKLDDATCRHLGRDLAPGEYLQINVADTGVGMDKKTLERIFEPFFTTKEPGKGTGMGLASVYGTVKNHKGAVTVYSEPGHGAVFKLYLPFKSSAGSSADDMAPASSIAQGSGRILVVDDEEVIRKFATDALTRLGYTVTACADGAEAVRHYQTAWRETNLIILDVIMPKMAGKETFAALRAINPAAKVLLSSGYTLNGESESLLAAGAAGFIQKPFQMTELSHMVAKAIGQREEGS